MLVRLKKARAAKNVIRVAARPAFRNEEMNPYNSLLSRALSSAGGVVVREHKYSMSPWECDIFHVHWPEYDIFPGSPRQTLKMAAFWTWLLLARLAGVKLVWTAHNSFSHDREPSWLNVFVWKRFLSMLDGVIYPSEESERIVTAEYPKLAKLPSALIKLGHFGPWIDEVRDSAALPTPDVRKVLDGLGNDFVVLNFGVIRRYKNIDELMRQFSALEDPKIRLLIVGKVLDDDYRLGIEALAKTDRRIMLLPRYLDGASLVACLERADLVVLPFRRTLNSSSALMAMNFGKHVVLPALGSMRSLQRDVGTGAVTLFEGSLNGEILRASIDRVRSNDVAPPNLRNYEWKSVGNQTIEYYFRLVGQTG